MRTPKEYLDKGLDIIPCQPDSRKPEGDNWTKRKVTINDFRDNHNIGLRLGSITDIDYDNQIALQFRKYMAPCGATFGKGDNVITHDVYKGLSKYKKFVFPKEFGNWSKSFSDPHENTIIENRSGPGHQTIIPGSVVEGKEVKWAVLDSISPYPNNSSVVDCGKVALATSLTILYPSTGERDDFCYAIAGVFVRHTQWTENEINEFLIDICTAAKDEEANTRGKKGSHAMKQIEQGSSVMGFPKLVEILGLEDAKPLYDIFSWVGVNPPNKNLEKLRKDHVFLLDSASMFNLETGNEWKKEDFNNVNLFKFPGDTKQKEKAYESLMKDYEFQDRVVRGRAVLPGYPYPIAEIDKGHFHLEPGKYLNLYKGHAIEPVKGDVSDWVNAYKKLYGEQRYKHVEDYLAAMFQKVFKHLLTLTAAESKAMTNRSKIQWGILQVGPEGTGKKALGLTIQRIMGKEYVDNNATYDQMIGSHSEVIYNKLFVAINEVVTTGDIAKKVEISNKLKPFWTDEDAKINPKYVRPFRYWNNCNGIALSNEIDCLHISNSSRRYLGINQYAGGGCEPEKLLEYEDDGTFARLYEFINSAKIAHLFYYFLYEVKITNWKVYNGGRAPETEDLIEMRDGNAHPIVVRLTRCLEQRLAPFDYRFVGFVSIDALLTFIREQWKTQINEKFIKNWLSDKGYLWSNGKKTRQMYHPKLGRPRVHLLLNITSLKKMTEGQLGSAYESDHQTFFETLNFFSTDPNRFENIFGDNNKSAEEQTKADNIRRYLKYFLGPKESIGKTISSLSSTLLGFLKYNKELGYLISANTKKVEQTHRDDPKTKIEMEALCEDLSKVDTSTADKYLDDANKSSDNLMKILDNQNNY
mgnify:FL=1